MKASSARIMPPSSGPGRRCAWSPSRRRCPRRAPAAFCWIGVANTLSTTRRAPAAWAISATAAMSIDCERRVGRAFQEERLGLALPHAFFHAARSVPSTSVELDAVARQQVLDHVAAGAEQRLRRDHMVAGLQLAEEDRSHRRHAARRGARRLRAFEEAHALLEHRHRRVGVARVDEARLVALEARARLARRCRRRSSGS